jgi:hypothetical protein
MSNSRINHYLGTGLYLSFVIAAVVCAAGVRGQDNRAQQLLAPPPLKTISKEELSQLSEAKDGKARIRVTVELAQSHLTKADEHIARQQYSDATAELGRYRALIEDALRFLAPMNRDSNKTRDLYKRLELALRGAGPRLTSMRRITPLEYAIYIKEIEDFARKGRTEALNSFYGHTVVREKTQGKPADITKSKDVNDKRP